MRKILTSCSFFMGSLLLVAAFMTATTYVQLGIAIFFYPWLVYFGFKAFPRKSWSGTTQTTQAVVQPQPAPAEIKTQEPVQKESQPEQARQSIGISDIDKRAFLKLIGGAGLSFFLFSIFSKKTESLFSKSLPSSGIVALQDANSNKIDPAQNQPMDGYRISEIEDSEISFYGYTNKDGAWFVMKVDTDTGSIRYSKGDSQFPDNWGNRANLKYDYYNNVF